MVQTKKSPDISGFLLVDKPQGWTSFDVCAKIRKQLKIKRVGHTGTLDPFATGLLIVAVGRATKLIPYLEKDRKTYITEILLGSTSETLDPESEIVSILPPDKGDKGGFKIPQISDIQKTLDQKFSGKIQQIPPKYSALKINGKKMYQLARAGEEFEIKSRETEIFSTKILAYNFPILKLEITAAAGFYVRSFARDLGEILAEAGMCQSLRRTCIEKISVKNLHIISEENLKSPANPLPEGDSLIDPQQIIPLPTLEIPTERFEDFRHGRAFPIVDIVGTQEMEPAQNLLLTINGKSIGVGEYKHGKISPKILL